MEIINGNIKERLPNQLVTMSRRHKGSASVSTTPVGPSQSLIRLQRDSSHWLYCSNHEKSLNRSRGPRKYTRASPSKMLIKVIQTPCWCPDGHLSVPCSFDPPSYGLFFQQFIQVLPVKRWSGIGLTSRSDISMSYDPLPAYRRPAIHDLFDHTGNTIILAILIWVIIRTFQLDSDGEIVAHTPTLELGFPRMPGAHGQGDILGEISAPADYQVCRNP